jgi:hypothetical protein
VRRVAVRGFKLLQTLQVRFLLALVLIGLLPLGLVGLGMATLNRRALAEHSARELTGLARGLAGQLAVYLDEVQNEARAIAALPEIVSMDSGRQDMLLKELSTTIPSSRPSRPSTAPESLSPPLTPTQGPRLLHGSRFRVLSSAGTRPGRRAASPSPGVGPCSSTRRFATPIAASWACSAPSSI